MTTHTTDVFIRNWIDKWGHFWPKWTLHRDPLDEFPPPSNAHSQPLQQAPNVCTFYSLPLLLRPFLVWSLELSVKYHQWRSSSREEGAGCVCMCFAYKYGFVVVVSLSSPAPAPGQARSGFSGAATLFDYFHLSPGPN